LKKDDCFLKEPAGFRVKRKGQSKRIFKLIFLRVCTVYHASILPKDGTQLSVPTTQHQPHHHPVNMSSLIYTCSFQKWVSPSQDRQTEYGEADKTITQGNMLYKFSMPIPGEKFCALI
jgi:hypothetical protein